MVLTSLNFRALFFGWLLLLVFICTVEANAAPAKTTYSAKIYKPDGLPLESINVDFRFTILDPSATCSIYVEDFKAVNMSSSSGLVFFSLGAGVRAFPVSGPIDIFMRTFDNTTASFPCDQVGAPYVPQPNDIRKLVMQFNDGSGWQTIPAMTINSVPYAMYASKSDNSVLFNGKSDSDFLQKAIDIPTCAAGTMLYFNNASFTCISVPASGVSINSVGVSGGALSLTGTVSEPVVTLAAVTVSNDGYLTAADYSEFKAKLSASSTQIISTLGYTPASSATVNTLSNTVTSLSAATAASFAALTSSQWATSGSSISYSSGNVGIGTNSPVYSLVVSKNQNNMTGIGLENLSSGTAAVSQFVLQGDNSSGSLVQLSSGNTLGSTYGRPSGLGLITSTSASGGITLSARHVSGAISLNTGGGLERMRITSSGNVGVGLTTPSAILHLKSGTSATASFKLTSGTLLSAPQAGAFEYDGSNLYFTDGTSTRRTIASTSVSGTYDNASTISNASGNITMAPNSGAGSVVVSATTASTNSSTGALVVYGGLGVAGSINAGGAVQGVSVTATNGMISPYIYGSTVSGGSLTLDSTTHSNKGNIYLAPVGGNVGIGTTTPAKELHVEGSMIVDAFTAGADKGIFFREGYTDTTPAASQPYNLSITTYDQSNSGSSNDSLSINANDGVRIKVAESIDAVVVKSSGNVGIGTTAPAQALHVAGNVRSDNSFMSNLGKFSNIESNDYILFEPSDDSVRIFSNDSEKMTILSNGNIGIGTSSPATKFHIQAAAPSTGVHALVENTGLNGNAWFYAKNDAREWLMGVRGSDDSFSIYDNSASTSRFTITTSGNVGVGTTNPQAALEVSGTLGKKIILRDDQDGVSQSSIISFEGATDGAHGWVGFASTADDDLSILAQGANGDLVLGAGNSFSKGLRIKGNTGNVGIGTTSPASLLHVKSNGDTTAKIDTGSIANEPLLELASSASGNSSFIGMENSVGGGIAVGTTPYSLVFKPSNGRNIHFVSNASGLRTTMDEYGTWTMTGVSGNKRLILKAAAGQSANMFEVQNNTGLGMFAVDGSGKLGVGTASPTAKLHVSDGTGNAYLTIADTQVGGSSEAGLWLESDGSSGGLSSTSTNFDDANWANSILLYSDPSASGGLRLHANGGSITFGNGWSPRVDRMVIKPSGDVGIGTTAPSYTLDVSGTLRVTAQAYTNTGNGSFSILSDIRYKDVHGHFDRGLSDILNIDIIKFHYKKNNPLGSDSSHEYIGVSAQNLQQSIPEAVESRKVGKEEYLTINTSPVLWTLVNAVKQIYEHIKVDKAEIEMLRDKSANLEAENAALKAYLCRKDPVASICK